MQPFTRGWQVTVTLSLSRPISAPSKAQTALSRRTCGSPAASSGWLSTQGEAVSRASNPKSASPSRLDAKAT